MLIAGAGAAAGRGKILIRAVSFFGLACAAGAELLVATLFGWVVVSVPGGFGNGCRSGETLGEVAGEMGGRRGKIVGASVVEAAEGNGAIFGGRRRTGATGGVREGKTMRAVSRLAVSGADPGWAGRGGSAIRTVSFFGSAINDDDQQNSHKPPATVTR
jgi:hypothetical protein